ncbi:hypothetical protein ACFL4G_07715 [Thermodesulfobacteriota bacterium]
MRRKYNSVQSLKEQDIIKGTRPKRRRIQLITNTVTIVFAIIVPLLIYIWTHLHFVSLGYRLSEARDANTSLQGLNEKLKIETLALRAPARIDTIATENLGLHHPRAGQWVVLEETE